LITTFACSNDPLLSRFDCISENYSINNNDKVIRKFECRSLVKVFSKKVNGLYKWKKLFELTSPPEKLPPRFSNQTGKIIQTAGHFVVPAHKLIP